MIIRFGIGFGRSVGRLVLVFYVVEVRSFFWFGMVVCFRVDGYTCECKFKEVVILELIFGDYRSIGFIIREVRGLRGCVEYFFNSVRIW